MRVHMGGRSGSYRALPAGNGLKTIAQELELAPSNELDPSNGEGLLDTPKLAKVSSFVMHKARK